VDSGPGANLAATLPAKTLVSGSATSDSFTPSKAGRYLFVAHYSGDVANNAVDGACGADNESVDALTAAIVLSKDPDQTHAYDGDKISFTIKVQNNGSDSLANVVLRDHIQNSTHTCETVTGPTGDNGNNLLDPGETWRYVCTVTVIHSEEIGGKIVNLAHVEGDTKTGGDHVVSNEDDAAVPIYHPAIAIRKTGPTTALAGDLVPYVLIVTNPGDEAFAETTLQITDPICNGAPVTLTGKGPDRTPATLDPGDVWTYTCSVQTVAGQTTVHNVVTVVGKDQFGTTRTATDTADTTLAQPQQTILGATGAPGTARLTGRTGCQAKAFNARVAGTKIAAVTFVLDGKVVKRLTKNASGVYLLRVNPAKMRVGVHRLVANVTFESGSATGPKTLRIAFQRCGRKLAVPRFTG
jgi:uncharacterized repeat protein (TIGR01451 family)